MSSGSRNTIALPAAAVAAFAFAIYLPTLAFQLVWDDPELLESVHALWHAGGLRSLVSAEFLLGGVAPHTGYYRPVVFVSMAADSWLGGGRPWLFHLTNDLLHAGVCALVVLILLRILDDGPAAVFGGLLFAAHPVHVEAVAFVSGRTDLWSALFVFAATALWMSRRRHSEGSGALAATALGVLLLLGALSKELAVMAIPAWLVWDRLGLPGDHTTGEPWWRRNRSWLLAAAAAVVVVGVLRWLALGSIVGGGAGGAPTESAMGPTAAALLLPRLATYSKLLVVPWPLSSYVIPSDLSAGPWIVVGMLLAAGTFVAAERMDSRYVGAAGFSWVLLFLLPVLGIARLNAVVLAERFLYVPSFGICLAGAALWGRAHRRHRAAALAVGGAVIAVFAGATIARSRVWRDEITLYTDMIKTSPNGFTGHFNLGNELAKAGRLSESESELTTATKVGPGRADGWNNLGSVRSRLGKTTEAVAALEEAVRLKPDLAVARRNLAANLLKLGRPADALIAMKGLDALAVDDGPALVEIGKASAEAGRNADAEEALRMAIRAAPDKGDAYGDLGLVYLSEGRSADAIPLLERSVKLAPNDSPTRFNLALARLANGDRRGAAAERDALRALDPRLADELTARLEREGRR